MTDSNKLVEMLNKSFAEQYEKRGLLTAQHTADDLLANGVFLLPEDLRGTQDFSISAFIEAMQMYKEKDRYIKTPCKVGDTVYVITTKRPCYACVLCTYYCHKNCSFNDKNELVVKIARVCAIKYETIGKVCVEIDKSKICHSYDYTYLFEDFGKTVFLTKEEAEQALVTDTNVGSKKEREG